VVPMAASLIEMPGKGPTRKNPLALVNTPLAGIAEPMRIADRCRDQLTGSMHPLIGASVHQSFLAYAKPVLAKSLREMAAVDSAYVDLVHVVEPPFLPPVMQALAFDMLGPLYAALAKREGRCHRGRRAPRFLRRSFQSS
jgi:hypothetical protein